MRLVIDTDALIKLTKSGAKELVGTNFGVLLPPQVRVECVDQGKLGGFPDAIRIEDNIRRGLMKVRKPQRTARTEAIVRELRLIGGEADVLRLFRSGGVDVVVSDDRRFLQMLEALAIPFATPSSLIVALAGRGLLRRAEALARLDALAEFISEEEYLEARRALEEG